MPHTSRDNFKAKWIAAREEIGANTAAKASVVEKTLGNIHDTQFSAGQELKKVQHVAMEAAAASRELISIMDECRNVNDLKFAECGLAIDEKLSQMPLNVMLRRVRDVVKMASVRIGYMTAAYEDMHKYVDAVEHQRRRLSDAVPQFQRELLSSVYIGPSPSTDEIEDYQDNRDGRFRRFGLDYQDLSDDWYETELFAESNLREKKSYKNEVSDRSDVESDDDDDMTNSAQSPQQRALVNRSARVVPRTNSIAL